MEGLRTGSYPDGATLAEEMLEWLSTPKGAKEGQRRLIGVMVKDGQRYSSRPRKRLAAKPEMKVQLEREHSP